MRPMESLVAWSVWPSPRHPWAWRRALAFMFGRRSEGREKYSARIVIIISLVWILWFGGVQARAKGFGFCVATRRTSVSRSNFFFGAVRCPAKIPCGSDKRRVPEAATGVVPLGCMTPETEPAFKNIIISGIAKSSLEGTGELSHLRDTIASQVSAACMEHHPHPTFFRQFSPPNSPP